jgi:diadenylate cyclase
METERYSEEVEQDLINVLKIVSPGTALRIALDDILKAGLGGLVVVGNTPNIMNLINGGFELNCKFTSQKLIEICKMDGAVVVDNDIKKIIYANTLLVPDFMIPTNETGTRHKAAERTAKQTNQFVIAISERKKHITLYKGGLRYVLKPTSEILARAGETIRMLEKHKEILNELLLNLNVLEFTGLASFSDVVLLLQRMEICERIADIIRRYIIELGVEGTLVKIQLKELIKGIAEEEFLLLKDYSKRDALLTKVNLGEISLEDLVEPETIIKALNYQKIEDNISIKGTRILDKVSLSAEDLQKLNDRFGIFQTILDSPVENLIEVIGESKAKILQKELTHLKEQVMLGKKI